MSAPAPPAEDGEPEADGPPPVFLGPQTYRRRRLGDAARLLPALGTALFLLPALGVAPGDGGARLAVVGGAWLALVLAAAILSRALMRPRRGDDGSPAP